LEASLHLRNLGQRYQWTVKTRGSILDAPAKSTFTCQSFV
jgi:hypothetical protein